MRFFCASGPQPFFCAFCVSLRFFSCFSTSQVAPPPSPEERKPVVVRRPLGNEIRRAKRFPFEGQRSPLPFSRRHIGARTAQRGAQLRIVCARGGGPHTEDAWHKGTKNLLRLRQALFIRN